MDFNIFYTGYINFLTVKNFEGSLHAQQENYQQ